MCHVKVRVCAHSASVDLTLNDSFWEEYSIKPEKNVGTRGVAYVLQRCCHSQKIQIPAQMQSDTHWPTRRDKDQHTFAHGQLSPGRELIWHFLLYVKFHTNGPAAQDFW